ncbi:bifunctional DNA-formamidopyrimidine glycosylase/DNA-(apurinic or apyrimidinic site) lyase [Methylomarinum sp. Ch1-1]|uniref:Formamidopyrimidine-DNA glycosylase n=1 Tax=Methylomarinum roseum TaxID=3067653 RepID=A0AAU7NUR4_9GAMM|nr:bifunctional DNA-formamidopyrimidine glycosylase/DNA-(apurinic or apyrimidinic site) lyase [Methylomarinum sp. Ch1-1]MDP4519579.1 bifunctional DNA-formamidopyrimidine glycosylase/DNA-(apurinic or apyrimidinic site) lyase [Methylomarinum sp. Ch1-1]
MPELPEVETTCRGITPHILGKPISEVTVRQARLRWPVPAQLPQLLIGLRFKQIKRRAKYLLLKTDKGTVIMHLGMSGSLRIVSRDQAPGKHDHIDIVFADDTVLRFNDPRRFGAMLWSVAPTDHPLLAKLGPEPLSSDFNGEYLYRQARNRKMTVKSLIMDGHIVVGVGNIYACESLFIAGIHPSRQAGRISLRRYQKLAEAIKTVLRRAIEQGGTTLRDFVNEKGNPGYFQQSLFVYGRANQPCRRCGAPIRQVKIAQRASYFCSCCQT